MKIKTWLLLSYLIVMILPLAAAYALFAWINSYHADRNVTEYVEQWNNLQKMKDVLDNPLLYERGADFKPVESLKNEQVVITLYERSGVLLFTTDPYAVGSISSFNREKLYQDFYTIKQQYRTNIYKAPVFKEGNVIGIYEITTMRSDWVAGVENRTWFVVSLFLLLFVSIFVIVIWFVNRKLNNPLNLLRKNMQAFGTGQQLTPFTKRQDEIGDLAESFAAMQDEIEKARQHLASEQQQKEMMIASISHDLKTPLTSISAYAEALKGQTLTKTQQVEYTEVIVGKATYMKQLLEDLLTYTLLQSANYEVERVSVDGQEFFDMLTSDYAPLCLSKNIELTTVCRVTGSYLVNPKQFMRLVDNLMTNALTHVSSNGQILLAALDAGTKPAECYSFVASALPKKNGMYVIVQNSGSGISEEDLARVFEPLYQGDTARTKVHSQGTGLGLSITKQIIEKHGGNVEMLSQQDIGTAVICYLPSIKGENQHEMVN
ncbi:HAMP domain-containing sensor histidine kinase [Psychrobacillus sp.]|uniref:sensor histidine kinase n=1 Tax=Psychrobacillus sp. TaxID=1871623 RepID=UPI0028BE192B|nr:HAMP domain-containing sensor histidine kinase [Psychrobacillus sp.]